MRYEVIVEPARRNHVAIVSVWESQAAFDKHPHATGDAHASAKRSSPCSADLWMNAFITLAP